MENNEIIELLTGKLKSEDMWFTQKTDPTWEEPARYYKLDEYGDLVESSAKQIVKEINALVGDGAVDITDAIDLWVSDACVDCRVAYKSALVTKFKSKPVVPGIEAYENSVQLAENYKRRLAEENNKSANLISDMFKSPDFDAESEQGKIVMRTSELFNALSDKGYDVQVAFDNGESTNSILLGQQGGQVVITITNTNQPLRAFTSGNFEITDEAINTLNDIQSQISAL